MALFLSGKTQDAWGTPFDITTPVGAFINKPDVQEAIEALYNLIASSSRAFIFVGYNGNANVGRYLEIFNGIDTSAAPLVVVGALSILQIVSRTTALSATCTIGFYDIGPAIPVLIYTLSMVAVKEVVLVGTPAIPIFVLPAAGKLAVKINSGSINTPHLYFSGQGG